MLSVYRISTISLTAVAGFDLYIDDPESGISRFHRIFWPNYDMDDGYEAKVEFSSRQMRYFTIHFPSYAEVKNLFIGLQADAFVGEGVKYRDIPPMVYYGSSITQGAYASRPGNIYQNMISRQTHIDYINLGFAGNGKVEDSIVECMAGLSMSAFISDYDHNAPTCEHLAATHC